MRRFWTIAIPAFLMLACVCPATSGLQESLEAISSTSDAGQTEVRVIPTDPPTSESSRVYAGTIRGRLSFPGESMPALRIVAFFVPPFATDPDSPLPVAASLLTAPGQVYYEMIILPVPGDFYILAYTHDGGFSAGYSEAVPCGLSADCTDHRLIPVHVDSGAVVEGIDPQDWYAGEGLFPPMP